MDKDNITDYRNKFTSPVSIFLMDFITHRNKAVDSFLVKKSFDLHASAISSTHRKPLHFFT